MAEGITKAYTKGGWPAPRRGYRYFRVPCSNSENTFHAARRRDRNHQRGRLGQFSPTGGSPSAYPIPEKQEEQTRTPVVNIHVYGNIADQDKFARELVPSIQKAIEDKAA